MIYIGHTGNTLENRFGKHRYDIKKRPGNCKLAQNFHGKNDLEVYILQSNFTRRTWITRRKMDLSPPNSSSNQKIKHCVIDMYASQKQDSLKTRSHLSMVKSSNPTVEGHPYPYTPIQHPSSLPRSECTGCTQKHGGVLWSDCCQPGAPREIGITPTEFSSNPKLCEEIIQTRHPSCVVSNPKIPPWTIFLPVVCGGAPHAHQGLWPSR